MPQQIEENLRDDVGFRQPGSSFRRQAEEAGQRKEVNDVSLSTFRGIQR